MAHNSSAIYSYAHTVPQSTRALFASVFANLFIVTMPWLPTNAMAVQTQQSGLIRSVVLDAPRDQALLMPALAGLRGRPLSPALRLATHQRLANIVDQLNWRNARIQVPEQLSGNGVWRVAVAGDPPALPRIPTPATRLAAPGSSGMPPSPTLDRWRREANARVLLVRSAHTLYAKLDGVVERFPVAVGRRSNPTPLGQYAVQHITHNPTWFPTKRMRAVALQRGRELPKRVPPGPDNPLGQWFVALGGSIGIHGNNSPWSIGRSVSSGCIRMRNADIERVARSLVAGDGVWVVDALARPAPQAPPPTTLHTVANNPAPLPRGVGLGVAPLSP